MKNNYHVPKDKLLDYTIKFLSDAEREVIDTHMQNCPTCRSLMQNQEISFNIISREINSAVKNIPPAGNLQFSKISEKIIKPKPVRYFRRTADLIPSIIAILGVVFILKDLEPIISALLTKPSNFYPTAYSTMACFILLIASVEQFDKARMVRSKQLQNATLAVLLWLGSALIGLQNIVILLDMFLGVIISSGYETSASFWGIVVTLSLAILYIVVVIGGGEYHYKHLGQPRSWKLFSLTIVMQLAILVLPFLIF